MIVLVLIFMLMATPAHGQTFAERFAPIETVKIETVNLPEIVPLPPRAPFKRKHKYPCHDGWECDTQFTQKQKYQWPQCCPQDYAYCTRNPKICWPD